MFFITSVCSCSSVILIDPFQCCRCSCKRAKKTVNVNAQMRCAGWYKMMIKFATLLILPLQSRNCLLTNCSRNCDIFLSLCLEYCFLPAEERKEPENVFLTHLGVWKLMCWGSSYMVGCNVPAAFLLLSVIACTTFHPSSPLKLARFSQCLFHCWTLF